MPFREFRIPPALFSFRIERLGYSAETFAFGLSGCVPENRMEENIGALDVALTSEDLSRMDAAFPAGAARGERYSEQAMRAVNR